MELREQLKQLEQTAVKLHDNMDTTIKQIPSIRKLTTLQSAVCVLCLVLYTCN